ncbi:MAG: response regulator transcription factor [Eubacterium sp.]|nr:response regulator transcription factor [Eubacterium sp.]
MKIIVVDDDRLVAVSLKTIIEAEKGMEVLAVAGSGEEAVSLYRELRPDILLTDIRMEGMTGLAAGEAILSEFPDAKILYLTTFNDDEYIIKALSIGAKGYIIKQDFDSIVPALKAVYGGQTVFGSEVTEKLLSHAEQSTPAEKKAFDYTALGLTDQEYAIVKCVADGLSNKEIADKLFLSEGTVRNYISTVLSKLDLRDRTNLAIFYYKNL